MMPLTATGFDISGTRVNLDIEVEAIQIIPMIIWSPGLKLLGADVSTLVMPIYGQTSIAANLSALNQRLPPAVPLTENFPRSSDGEPS